MSGNQHLAYPITTKRHSFAIGVIGGSTTVLDYGGMRFVSDPAFDPPGDFGPYNKTVGPAISPDTLGEVDAVLLSHDLHIDNFDYAGRQFAAAAPILITGPQAARRLGGHAVGLDPYASTTLGERGRHVTVSAVPAQHGPADGERDEFGNINTEVTGFILQSGTLPTVYLSGDNASIVPVIDIAARFPDVRVAVLHIGGARVPSKQDGRPLTLTADRATDVAQLLGVEIVIPAHYEGWSLYSEGIDDIRNAFSDSGIGDMLRYGDPGTWAYIAEL